MGLPLWTLDLLASRCWAAHDAGIATSRLVVVPRRRGVSGPTRSAANGKIRVRIPAAAHPGAATLTRLNGAVILRVPLAAGWVVQTHGWTGGASRWRPRSLSRQQCGDLSRNRVE